MTDLSAWPPKLIEDIFLDAIGAGDVDGVEGTIRLMLAVDPRRGIAMYDALKTGLAVVDLMSVADGSVTEDQIRRLIR